MPASMQSLTQLAESIHNPAIAENVTALRQRLVEIQQEAQELIERLDALPPRTSHTWRVAKQ